MGQLVSCFRDHCQKRKRRKTSQDTNSSREDKSLIPEASNINDSKHHRVILIEEQDDPNEVVHSSMPPSSAGECEVVSPKLPDLPIQVKPSATYSPGPIAPLAAPEDTADLRSSIRSAKVRSRSPSPPVKVSVKKSKLENYLNFPIFEDRPTKEYIPKAKVAIIMRGLSGSGKSHLAQKLIENFGDHAVECSADLYFVQPDGSYAFDPTLLKDAHGFCYESAKHEMSVVKRPLVIINNTNVKLWEFKKYLYLAKDHNYTTLIMEPKTPWAWNPKILAQKNLHSVDEESIAKRLSSYERSEPIYFGWFLNLSDSCELLRRAFACLRQVVDDAGYRQELAHACMATAPHFLQGGGGSPRPYYSPCGSGGVFQSLHCTAMFSGKGKRPGAIEYHQRPQVQQNLGKVYTLKVTDVVITPRTVGARVVLSPEQLHLWGQDDETEVPDNVAGLYAAVSECGDVEAADTEQMESFLQQQANSDPALCEQDGSVATLRTHAQDCLKGLTPEESGPGSRAHITLAVAPGVSPVVTGFDLLHVMALRDQSLTGGAQTWCGAPKTTKLGCGTVTQYDGAVFVVHLHERIEMTALFSAFY